MTKQARTPPDSETLRPPRVTKKDQMIALYLSGINDLEELARMTDARPSYVGMVLQRAGLLSGYFDLGVALFRRRSLDDLQVRSPSGTLCVVRLRGWAET